MLLFGTAHSLADATDNDVGTLVQSQRTGIDDHVIVACVGPAASGILEVMVVTSGVDLLYAFCRRLSVEMVFLYHSIYGILTVGGYEYTEGLLVITEYPVGTTANDNTRFLDSKLSDDAALTDKDGVVVGWVHGDRNALVGENEFPQL